VVCAPGSICRGELKLLRQDQQAAAQVFRSETIRKRVPMPDGLVWVETGRDKGRATAAARPEK